MPSIKAIDDDDDDEDDDDDDDHLNIIQTMHEQHTRKAYNQGITKTAILCSAHILWKVLIYKYKTFITCKVIVHVAQIVSTEQLQQYIA